jgi:hypothetical protein
MMEQAVLEGAPKAEVHEEHDVAVAVITPVGTYPDEDDFRRVRDTTVIARVLEQAAEKLKLTNTSDWVARVHDRGVIDVTRTFREEHLAGIVEIEWHKHEGGGGA